MPELRCVGIDPSLTGTGIVTPDHLTVVDTGTGDERLWLIHGRVTELAAGADLAIVEDLPTHAHGAGKTGMAQGVVRLALVQLGVPYALVTAATVKKFATGKGTCTKPDMRVELFKRTGLDIRNDNICDAWWLRALGMAYLGTPLLDLPLTHLAAMAAVKWPLPGAVVTLAAVGREVS